MGYTDLDWLAINTIRVLAVCFLFLPLLNLQFHVIHNASGANLIDIDLLSLNKDTDDLQTDATFRANSGHPGAPMGLAPAAHVLFNRFMSFNPSNPEWPNRDRFVLSYVIFKDRKRLCHVHSGLI